MYNDMTMIDVDLANLESGAISPYTDMAPLYWLCLHDYWIHILISLGSPYLNEGMRLLLEPTEFNGEQTDYFDIEISEAPFVIIPTGLQIGIVTQYAQLNEDGSIHADN